MEGDPSASFGRCVAITLSGCCARLRDGGRVVDLHQLVSEHLLRGRSPIRTRTTSLTTALDLPPSVLALLAVHDAIATRAYSPVLPPIAHEVDEDDGVAVKIVRLVRNGEPLGATVKCEADGKVLIARVMNAGLAHRSGCIEVGDECVEVNGVPVTGCDAQHILALMAADPHVVTFKLVPSSGEPVNESVVSHGVLYARRHAGSVHLRALSDYTPGASHPCVEAGLALRTGDILRVLCEEDPLWWQASLVNDARTYLVPAARNHDEIVYEQVSLMPPLPHRPIVLVGPSGVGRNQLQRRLLALNCERYATTVPYTSRACRADEQDGREYTFVARHTMETWIKQGDFLEYGEYHGNLYGTLLSSVHAIMTGGKTVVLTPHPQALPKLRTAAIRPYIIFVQAPSYATLRQTRGDRFTDRQLVTMAKNGEQLATTHGKWADYTLVNGRLEFAFRELCDVLHTLETKATWVPHKWM